MKVDFMIIGAQKCATTTLFQILDQHPRMIGCDNKEPHFFSTSKNWREEVDSYHELFKKGGSASLYFEASTTYTFAPHRKKRIWDDLYEYNPDLKLIYMVRNPLDRIVSSYMHAYERGYTSQDIDDALRKQPYFLDLSRYDFQIRPYIERYGADNVKVLDFDDFNVNRREVLSEITDFLGVEPLVDFDFEAKRSNVSLGGNKRHKRFDRPRWWHSVLERRMPSIWEKITDNSSRAFDQKPEIPDWLRQELLKELEPDIKAMERLFDKDLSHWRI